MFSQERAFPWGLFSFFRNGRTMQDPVSGTVARGAPDVPVPQPATISAQMLSRGQEKFNADCVPCHGYSGDGNGLIVQRGFPKPPQLYAPDLMKAKAAHFYDVITNGHGVMYSYADRVSPADRWAIIAYIRALQLSQRAQVASLSNQDKAALQQAPP
jgi:mono/diheme cytochrome c family protein